MSRRARARRGAWWWVGVVGGVAAITGCGEPPWAAPPAKAGLVDESLVGLHDPGAVAWQRHCAICHGAEGAGDGFNATLLAVKPATAAAMAARGAGLEAAIAQGSAARGASPLCPPWEGALAPAEVAAVAAHVGRLGARPAE